MRALRPARTVLRPARMGKKIFFFFFLQNVIAVFVFSDRDVKTLVKCLQICTHVFIDRPQNCAQTSFRSCAGLRPNFGHSRSKLCPIMCRLRTKLCPNFGRSRTRLCPISFAPCPFPNLAGTLLTQTCTTLTMASNKAGRAHNARLTSLRDRLYALSVFWWHFQGLFLSPSFFAKCGNSRNYFSSCKLHNSSTNTSKQNNWTITTFRGRKDLILRLGH